jgi:hypothetical protein
VNIINVIQENKRFSNRRVIQWKGIIARMMIIPGHKLARTKPTPNRTMVAMRKIR